MTLSDYLGESAAVLEAARAAIGQDLMDRAIDCICTALSQGKPLLLCGNGGSAADAMHITGELVGRFLKERRAYRAICLSSNAAVLTAWANDYSYDEVFARQVEAYGEPGAVILGISTSGNAKNVRAAFEQASRMGMTIIAMTGEGGGPSVRWPITCWPRHPQHPSDSADPSVPVSLSLRHGGMPDDGVIAGGSLDRDGLWREAPGDLLFADARAALFLDRDGVVSKRPAI